MCQEFKHLQLPVLPDPPDMKSFKRLLKRSDDAEAGKGCTEVDQGGHKDAEGCQTRVPRTEDGPAQGYQVGREV